MLIEHPELPFTIEPDSLGGDRYIRRYPTGAVEASNSTEYLLGLVLMKVDPPSISAESNLPSPTLLQVSDLPTPASDSDLQPPAETAQPEVAQDEITEVESEQQSEGGSGRSGKSKRGG